MDYLVSMLMYLLKGGLSVTMFDYQKVIRKDIEIQAATNRFSTRKIRTHV